MYEYVQPNEYKPVREQLEKIIHAVQKLLRPSITFQYHLIGSGSRHLITRIKGGNKGFDFDYNLVLQNLKPGERWVREVVKPLFYECFSRSLEKY